MLQKIDIPAHLLTHKVKWGPIGEQVYNRTYSHTLSDGSKETWPETVVRVVRGNLSLVDKKFIEADEESALTDLLLDFGIIPAGRHLNASGLNGRQFLNNCHGAGYSEEDPSLHFSFLFDQLMQGGGVGSNYSNRYINNIPHIQSQIDLRIVCDHSHENFNEFADHVTTDISGYTEYYQVEDSREGWVDALSGIIKNYFSPKGEIVVAVDVSKIRARGKPLKTSGGIACGPGPLVDMLIDVVKEFNSFYGRKLTSLGVMSIDHTLAACVVAGGKRRSSRMSVKSWRDYDIFEFIHCKRQDGANWSTNISVEIDNQFIAKCKEGDQRALEILRSIAIGCKTNGEPGVWNIDLSRKGERNPDKMFCTNPCGEIPFEEWENCCLGHVNLAYFATMPKKEAMKAFRLTARWLVRATFGDVPQKVQRDIMDKNRRIGVGFLGFHEWLAMRGIKYTDAHNNEEVKAFLSEARKVVTEAATAYAKELNIPVPVKFTTLAPNGTIACLPGVTSSAQAMMYKWFKRLVRYSDMDPALKVLKEEGYEIFKDPDARNTSIVVYWCEDPLVAKVAAVGLDPDELLEIQTDLSIADCLTLQSMLQEVYVDNAISYTINISPDKVSIEEIESTLLTYLDTIKGTTIFPEHSRNNAPIQPISKEEFDNHVGPKEVSFVENVCLTGCPVK